MKKIKGNRTINPEKSNKMIYAVAGGLLVVFFLFGWMITRGGGGNDDQARMESAVSYLKDVTGIGTLSFFPAENRLRVNVDASFTGEPPVVAHAAAMRLQNALSRPAVVEWQQAGRLLYRVRTEAGGGAVEERFPTP